MLSIESQNAVGEVFNTGAGVPTTVLHLVEMVKKILGKDKINLFATPRVGDLRQSLPSISKAQNLLDIIQRWIFKLALILLMNL